MAGHHQHRASIRSDVQCPSIVETICKGLHETILQVVFRQVRTVSPSRLTIVRLDDFVYLLAFLRTFLSKRIEQPVFGWRHLEIAFRKIVGEDSFLTGQRVDSDELTTIYPIASVIIKVALRHPLKVFGALSQDLTGSQFLDGGVTRRTSTHLCGAV